MIQRSSFKWLVLGMMVVGISLGLPALGQDGDSEETKYPVVIKIPEKSLSEMTAAQRASLEVIKAELEKSLYTLADPTFELPPTLIPAGEGEIIQLRHLFRGPTSDEVSLLAQPRQPLSQEQLESIREEAIFSVPSKEYPGQFHVWKIGGMVQKGRKNIEISWETHKKDGVHAITVRLPARIWGERPLSIRRGLRNIATGLWQIKGLLVGTTESLPEYSESEVEAIIKEEATSYATHYAEEHLDTRKIDLRPYSHEIESAAAPVVNRIIGDVLSKWNKAKPDGYEDEYLKMKTSLTEHGVPNSEIEAILEKAQTDAQLRLVYEAMGSDAELEAVYPGLGRTYARRMEAMRIVLGDEARFMTVLVEQFPDEAERMAAYHEGLEDFWHDTAERLSLEHDGAFAEEAAIMDYQVRYYLDHYERRAMQLGDQTKPKRIFRLSYPIWNQKAWTVVGNAQEGFELVDVKWSTVPTTGFWRMRLLGKRIGYLASNLSYNILVDNLWNGPMGLKSLVGSRPFLTHWEADEGGVIVPYGKETQTLASRIGAQYRIRREILDDFAQKRDFGLFGGNIERALLSFRADIWHGAVAPGLLAVLQPVVTAANVGISAGGTVLAIAGAPLASIAISGYSVLFSDIDNPNSESRHAPRFSLLSAALFKTALCGLGQCAASIAAVAGHGVESAAHFSVGGLQAIATSTRDRLAGWFMKRFANVPGRDSRPFVQRISGPGLSNEYYFQVDPALVVMSTWASIERASLRGYQSKMENKIRSQEKPLDEFTSVLEALFGSSINIEADSPAGEGVMSRVDEQLEKLRKFLEPSRAQMGRAPREELDEIQHIRMTAAQLAQARAGLAYLVEQHPVGKTIAQPLREGVGRTVGEFVDSWLEYTFGRTITVPLEVSDPTFSIRVHEPRLSSRLDALLQGYVAQPVVTGVDPASIKPVVAVEGDSARPRRLSLDIRDLCQEAFVSRQRLDHKARFWR